MRDIKGLHGMVLIGTRHVTKDHSLSSPELVEEADCGGGLRILRYVQELLTPGTSDCAVPHAKKILEYVISLCTKCNPNA